MNSVRKNAALTPYIVLRPIFLFGALALLNVAAWGQTVTATFAGAHRAVVNPVTNKIYLVGTNGVTVIDGATNATTLVQTGANPAAVSAIAVNPVTNKVYAANEVDGTVTIIDGATNSTSTVSAGGEPFAMAVDPILNQIYVGTRTSVTVINGANNAITSVPLTSLVNDIAVNIATHNVYIAHCDGDGTGTDSHLSILDGATLQVSVVTVAGRSCNDRVAVNAVTNRAYFANQDSAKPAVIVINGTSDQPVVIPLSRGPSGAELPFALAVNPVTGKIYVGGSHGTVTIIDEATTTTSTLTAGVTADSLAVNPVTNQIYVPDELGNVLAVIDGLTLAVTTLTDTGTPREVAINPVTNKVYVAGDARSVAMDGATNKTTSVQTGLSPAAVAVNAVTGNAYVANSNSASVTVIDRANGSAQFTVPTGTNPVAVGVNAATNKIYVANKDSQNVTVIDGVTNTTATVAAGTSPVAVAVNSSTNLIYIANQGSASVTVIDGTTNVPATISVGTTPVALAVNPTANQIYVANKGSNNVTVINGDKNTTTTIAAGNSPFAVAVNPITNKAYIVNGDSTVVVVDGTSLTTSTVPVGVGPVSISVNTVTNKIYTANQADGTVTEIDGVSNLTTTIPAGAAPVAVAVNQTSNKIYAVNGDNNVIVIDGATNITSTVGAGSGPIALAVDPVANKVYVANAFDGSVTVIAEQQVQPLPLTTAIAPQSFSGLQSPASNPIFTFTPQSNYFPFNPAPHSVYFQVDSWEGPWTPAQSSGGPFSGQTPSLALGDHVLFAYAGDGTEATALGRSETLIGQIESYPFTVIASAAIQPQIILNVPNATVTVTRGGSATYILQVSAQGTLPTAVTFKCGPLPANTACTFNPASVNATSIPTSVTLTITTTAPTVAVSVPAGLNKPGLLFAMGLLLPALVLCAPAGQRRRADVRGKRWASIGVMTLLLLSLVACGSNAKTPTVVTPTGGTPTGAFTVTITSTAGSVQTTTALTLKVQ